MEIFVENISAVGYHGYYEEERRDGRRFVVDLGVDVADPTDSDVLEHTVDYRRLASIVMKHIEGESVKLIETLGTRILDDVFDAHPRVTAAKVTLRKQATGVPGDPEYVGIQLSRRRKHV